MKFTQEIRCHDITYADAYLYNVQGGLIYKLPKNFYLAFLYKREHVKLEDIPLDENRFNLQGGWKIKVANDLEFDIRARAEIRKYNDPEQNHTRFRFRFRFIYNTLIGNLRLKPFIATETFGRTKVYTIQRNRLYLGTFFPLSDHVELIACYIWLYTTGKESVHILNSGIELSF